MWSGGSHRKGSRQNHLMNFGAPVVLVFFCVCSCAASAPTSPDEVEQYFRDGRQAMQKNEFARAAEDFRKALALDPGLVEAEVNLGLAYQGLFDYSSAVRCLAKALRQRPDLPGPTLIVGLDYLKLSSPQKAIPYLQRALELDPSNRYAHEALAASYLSQENFPAAADQFRKVAALTPDKDDAWFRLGHQYLDLASRLAYRGARLYPQSAWGHRFLGDLFFQRSRWKDARSEYEKALISEPRQAGLHTLLGLTHLRAHEFDESEKEFRGELELAPRDELAWLGLASLNVAATRMHAAIECVDKVWQISPEFLALQQDFPSVELSQEAARAALPAIDREPEGAAKHLLAASLSSAAGESVRAAREWKLLNDDVALARQESSNLAGRKYEDTCKAHRYSLCIDSLQARRSLTPAERIVLGRAQFAMRQYEAAAITLEQVPATVSESAQASYWLERSYQELGAETYARLMETFPGSWRTHQLRAEDAALRGDFDGALKQYQAALESRANEPELHAAVGELYLEHHTYDAAQGELEKALSLDASSVHTLYLLGR